MITVSKTLHIHYKIFQEIDWFIFKTKQIVIFFFLIINLVLLKPVIISPNMLQLKKLFKSQTIKKNRGGEQQNVPKSPFNWLGCNDATLNYLYRNRHPPPHTSISARYYLKRTSDLYLNIWEWNTFPKSHRSIAYFLICNYRS